MDHHGGHCSYNDAVKSRICRKCQRKETLRENTYEHWVPAPRTEYDILKEKLNPPETETDRDSAFSLVSLGELSVDTAMITYSWVSDTVSVVTTGQIILTLGGFLSYWQEYSDSCFVDSTAVYADSGGVPHTCLVYGCNQVWDVPPTKVLRGYHHRTPDFPGFVEFLKRRKR